MRRRIYFISCANQVVLLNKFLSVDSHYLSSVHSIVLSSEFLTVIGIDTAKQRHAFLFFEI
jgi:hypothetical protein